MKVVVSGSSGFVGSALIARLEVVGREVLRLVRRPIDAPSIVWDPEKGVLPTERLEDADAFIHLAGENISDGRWTDAKKRRIRESRVQGTRLLAETLARLPHRPRTLILASATGYYGERGDELLDESASAGAGFLADVCKEWEGAANPAIDAGVRVVILRFGVVLHPTGGALRMMLTPFRFGLGGRMGGGKQWSSWITRDDLVAAILFLLDDPERRGVFNGTAPNPTTNEEFTRALGRVLRRPTFFSVPAAVLRLALGELADAVLLASARVAPERLSAAGFKFHWPTLEPALRWMLLPPPPLLHPAKLGE